MHALQQKTITVLGYHKIGNYPPDGWYTWSYIPADVFEKQLQFIKENNWTVLSYNEFRSALSNPAQFPEKSILITFDDGYQSNLKIAVPILKKYNFPAVMFVPTAFIGSYNAFDADIFYEPKEEICTWEELIELERSGISIQSHSVTHPHFSDVSTENLQMEISKSKEVLEQRLNKKIEALSFPYGDSGFDSLETESILTKAGYIAAFLFDDKLNNPVIDNTFRISRLAVGPDTILDKRLNYLQ